MSQQNVTESPEKAQQWTANRESSPDSAQSFQGGLHPIARLQWTLGNRNVAKLIQAKRLTPDGKIIGLPRKLTVGAADDQYEQEADRVARQVMSMPNAVASHTVHHAISPKEDQEQTLQTKPLAASITPFVQRQVVHNEASEDEEQPVQARFFTETSREPLQRQSDTEEEETEPIQAKSVGSLSHSFEAGADVESQISGSIGRGSPLPDPVRAYMEPRFGVDFSQVRVHTGSDAIRMNRDIGAQAFTHGSNIYFGGGHSPTNLELTAHELTHVVQQQGSVPAGAQSAGRVERNRPEPRAGVASARTDSDPVRLNAGATSLISSPGAGRPGLGALAQRHQEDSQRIPAPAIRRHYATLLARQYGNAHVQQVLGPEIVTGTELPAMIEGEGGDRIGVISCGCGESDPVVQRLSSTTIPTAPDSRPSPLRSGRTLYRKTDAKPAPKVDPREPINAAVGATPENLQLAQVIDELDKLSDAELYKRRDEAVVGATRDGGDDQDRHIRTLEAIEFLASRRGLDALKPNWDQVSRRKPIPRRLNVRVLIEEGVREKGSFKQALAAFTHTNEIEPDIRFFEAEAERFKRQFRGQARLTADRMLEESLQAISKVLSSYGLPPGSARSAARELAAGTGEVDELAEAVVASAKRTSDVDEPTKEKHRESLAVTVENLKKHQTTIKQLEQKDKELFEQWRQDRAKFDKALTEHARTIDRDLEAARNALKGAWIKAERRHPVLAAYRRDEELENIDLGKLDTDPVDRQMKAVIAKLLPKMVDIGKARAMLKNDLDFAVKLPSVVALTRANMFIPEGSLRAGMVNDLAAEAKGDDSLIRAAALAIALLTLIPTGGASLAIPLGIASAGLAVYSVTKEWEKYKTVKTLANTDLDLARSLSAEEPSLTGFAVSLVELGLEGLPLIGAFKKARELKRLVNAGEDTAEVVKDLNRIGKAHDAGDLGERALREAGKDVRKASAAERGAAKAAKVADDIPIRNLTNAQLADADVIVKMGDFEHTISAWKFGGRIQINYCTTCGSMIEKIDNVLAQISPTGPTKSLHRRLTKLRSKVQQLEQDINAGKVTFKQLPKEANKLAGHMRDLDTKFPKRFEKDLDVPNITRPDVSDFAALADRLGYSRTPFHSHGKPVYEKSGFYITPDRDSHLGGVWKGATSPRNLASKEKRSGTYDANMKRIGD